MIPVPDDLPVVVLVPVAVQPQLFHRCPVPACPNLVDDPRWPCDGCEAALAGWIRPSGREVTVEQAVAELAERDAYIAEVHAGRRLMIPLESR